MSLKSGLAGVFVTFIIRARTESEPHDLVFLVVFVQGRQGCIQEMFRFSPGLWCSKMEILGEGNAC